MMKNILQGIGRAASIGALVVGTLLPLNPANADGSLEVMASDKATTLDIKINEKVNEKAGLFFRVRNTIEQGKQHPFALADATYSLGKGFDAVVETQFAPNSDFIFRPGVQYFKKFGNFSLYFLLTGSIEDKPEFEATVNIGYVKPLTEKTNFYSRLENVTNIKKGDHNFSVQRVRVGLSKGNYTLGIGSDIGEIGGKPLSDYNIGAFLSRKF